MSYIYNVVDFNKMQDECRAEYIEECKRNGVEPLINRLDDYYPKFDYKRGFVMDGKYPIYSKLKRDFL